LGLVGYRRHDAGAGRVDLSARHELAFPYRTHRAG
jgi:hypothetical protein